MIFVFDVVDVLVFFGVIVVEFVVIDIVIDVDEWDIYVDVFFIFVLKVR